MDLMTAAIRILMIGDIFGKPGRAMVKKWAAPLKERYKADAIVVNGENSAKNGKGITMSIAQEMVANGVSMVTTGNHVWSQEETRAQFAQYPNVLRPANFPSTCPGKGHGFFNIGQYEVAVINIQGNVFMHENLDCPFRTMDSLLTYVNNRTKIILVDMHAETTAEKANMSFYLDGRVSAVVGTHTHVQTADERILPKGTAFITDLGACCALNSSLGMKHEGMMQRILTQMPFRGEVDTRPPFALHGVLITIDPTTGKATGIERIKVVDNDISADLVD
jgi:metallophosphoesterase (TIGR00282 family)